MVNSPLGKIPEGWEVKKATDAIAANPTTKVPREGEKPFVSMGNLSNDSMLINGLELRSGIVAPSLEMVTPFLLESPHALKMVKQHMFNSYLQILTLPLDLLNLLFYV